MRNTYIIVSQAAFAQVTPTLNVDVLGAKTAGDIIM
jgi:hypothetical protein